MNSGTDTIPGQARAEVLSTCNLARAGMLRVLEESGWSVSEGAESPGASLIVVWLAVPLRQQLTVLERLGKYLDEQDGEPSVLLVCRMATDWLWQYLPRQLDARQIPVQVRVVDAGLSVSGWRQVFSGRGTPVCLSCMNRLGGRNAGLTRREMQALHDLLEGGTVRSLSVRHGLSPKTLYVHRYSALNKMAAALTPGPSTLRVRRSRLLRELAVSYTWLSGRRV